MLIAAMDGILFWTGLVSRRAPADALALNMLDVAALAVMSMLWGVLPHSPTLHIRLPRCQQAFPPAAPRGVGAAKLSRLRRLAAWGPPGFPGAQLLGTAFGTKSGEELPNGARSEWLLGKAAEIFGRGWDVRLSA
eukprot:349655-Chlamydomonas_euryale.AAC.12